MYLRSQGSNYTLTLVAFAWATNESPSRAVGGCEECACVGEELHDGVGAMGGVCARGKLAETLPVWSEAGKRFASGSRKGVEKSSNSAETCVVPGLRSVHTVVPPQRSIHPTR